MKLITSVLVLAIAIHAAYALCNTCSAVTGLACVANDHFQVCVDGIPVAPAVQCPKGTFCSPGVRVCSPEGSVQPSCNKCRACSTVNSFACLSYNTYAMCMGSVVMDFYSFTCSGSLVCNIDAIELCIDPTITGIGFTCPSIEMGTKCMTNPDPTINPQAYCASVATSGRYEVTSDPTCKKYIFCMRMNNTWIGNVYMCPGSTLFNPISMICGVEVPSRCA